MISQKLCHILVRETRGIEMKRTAIIITVERKSSRTPNHLGITKYKYHPWSRDIRVSSGKLPPTPLPPQRYELLQKFLDESLGGLQWSVWCTCVCSLLNKWKCLVAISCWPKDLIVGRPWSVVEMWEYTGLRAKIRNMVYCHDQIWHMTHCSTIKLCAQTHQ